MNDQPKKNPPKRQEYAEQVAVKTKRKLKARRNPNPGVWFGLGMMGLIGWAISIPTLLGAALGVWLDRRYPAEHSWTLALLVAGLVLGCFNAWHWLTKEERAMHQEEDEEDAEEGNDD